MGKTVAIVVSLVLTLALIGYAIIPKVAAAQDISDKTDIEVSKMSSVMDDPSIVTGNTVFTYDRQSQQFKNSGLDSFNVYVQDEDGKGIKPSDVRSNALYKIYKEYNALGKLEAVTFTLIDLSTAK